MGGNPLKANQAAFALLIVGLVLATALTGIKPIGYHEECVNGLDDDTDTWIDGFDASCYYYPFEDGNGESDTLPEDRYTGSNYASLFEYHRDYTGADPAITADAICQAIDENLYSQSDFESAIQWIAENGFTCESGP